MTAVDDVLSTARSQLGVREDPPGSNRQPFGAWYTSLGHPGFNGVSWCAEFVSWVFAHSVGLGPIEHEWAYVPYMVTRSRQLGRFIPAAQLQPGDVIFYDWTGDGLADHVGLVEQVLGGGRYVTLEGNTSSGDAGSQSNGDGVYRRQRGPAYVLGGWRPAYVSARRVRVVTGTTVGALAAALGVAVTALVGVGSTDPAAPVAPGTTIAIPDTAQAAPQLVIPAPAPAPAAAPSPAAPAPVPARPTSRTYRLIDPAVQRQLGVTPDGIQGPVTTAAIRAAQDRCGITVDGIVGPVTHACLSRGTYAPRHSAPPILRVGSTGTAVRLVQRPVGAAVDGIYGPRTRTAVIRWQARHHLVVDGVVGPATRTSLGL